MKKKIKKYQQFIFLIIFALLVVFFVVHNGYSNNYSTGEFSSIASPATTQECDQTGKSWGPTTFGVCTTGACEGKKLGAICILENIKEGKSSNEKGICQFEKSCFDDNKKWIGDCGAKGHCKSKDSVECEQTGKSYTESCGPCSVKSCQGSKFGGKCKLLVGGKTYIGSCGPELKCKKYGSMWSNGDCGSYCKCYVHENVK